MLDKVLKIQLRARVRDAIVLANLGTCFSCHDCAYCYQERVVEEDDGTAYRTVCGKNILPVPSTTMHPCTSLLACFEYGHINGPFADVLNWMARNGIPFEDADRGWPTLVNRIISRTNFVGHLLPMRPGNLDKFRW